MKHSRVVRFSMVVLLAAAFVSIHSSAHAQLNWHATQRMQKTYPYSLGCWQNVVTACTVQGTEDSVGLHLTFYRSDDAGISWKQQTVLVPSSQLKPIPDGLYGRGVTIDQIDSTHAIAVGTAGLILSTTDAGNTWSIDSCPIGSALRQISCSTFEEGIITAFDTPAILIRVQKSWQCVPLRTSVRQPNDSNTWSEFNFWSSYMGGQLFCHAYGEGKYRVICQGKYSAKDKRTQMELYTTTDHWNSVDSVAIPFWSIDSGTHVDWNPYVCFGGGDSITVFGESWIPNKEMKKPGNTAIDTICPYSYGIVARTIDGGKHWDRVTDTSNRHGYSGGDPTGSLIMGGPIDSTSIFSYHHEVELVSHNSGFTWQLDSMRFDDASDSGAFLYAVVQTANGSTIGAFEKYDRSTQSYAGFLAKLAAPQASVAADQELPEESVYPNPAISVIYSRLALTKAKIIDALGRVCDVQKTSASAFDVSKLPPGVYYMTDETHRVRFVKQ